ncbi:tRNA1(Val) (adenine(37)-N6)-methyltransferase [Porphyridium purpureum]|uniref:tRNA1(Val) (Adenine(37)-N6)-methyltransferase n=1 Tax=Porphyridium purpureum TaxID=35688 RepID=A0A5J4YMA0_PORPP|nr:tRNA1(Val) (adenine(37)-N6)-methyltransferase [Porphyridium purpureum]|eukprot:POR4230..scf295_9
MAFVVSPVLYPSSGSVRFPRRCSAHCARATNRESATQRQEPAEPAEPRKKRAPWTDAQLASLPRRLWPQRGLEDLHVILRRRILLLQAVCGYRANTDSQLLAYFAVQQWRKRNPTREPERVLELGSGNGLVSILLAKTWLQAHVTLVELQESLAQRGQRNLELNGVANHRAVTIQADIAEWESSVDVQGRMPMYDIVLTNPPFYALGGVSGRHPPIGLSDEKRVAHFESSAGLTDFLRAMAGAMSHHSLGFVIQSIDERARLLDCIALVNDLRVVCVQRVFHSRMSVRATRVLVMVTLRSPDAGEPGSEGEREETPPIYLHDHPQDIRYDDAHELWLRDLPGPPWPLEFAQDALASS